MKDRKTSSVQPKNDRVYAINSKGQATPQQTAHQPHEQQQGEVQTSIGPETGRNNVDPGLQQHARQDDKQKSRQAGDRPRTKGDHQQR